MNTYLNKYAYTDRLINEPVNSKLNLVVVIPCYNEPNLIRTLDSLKECDIPSCHTEIIVVINNSDADSNNIKQHNKETLSEAKAWNKNYKNERLIFHFITAFDLPKKIAGVGLARKIGLDEAVRRLDNNSISDGVLICLDADCTVDKNYLTAIEKYFQDNPKSPSCHLAFKHILNNDILSKNHENTIAVYELYLRWYKLNLEYCRHPYSYFTIGSCIAVRSSVYQKQGGMNKRKAGEDFYFLQKIFPLENFSELNSTCVYPSSRKSDRVPFGTGAFINQNENLDILNYKSFNPILFSQLKSFIEELKLVYDKNEFTNTEKYPVLSDYFNSIGANNHLKEICSNSSSFTAFRKRFFRWFNGLIILQYLHYGQKSGVEDITLMDSCVLFLKLIGYEYNTNEKNVLTLLKTYREIERLYGCEKPVFKV